ncbi:MAG: hypothetical protein WD512_07230, partial [Candidatus Paceibacterota bacterium]
MELRGKKIKRELVEKDFTKIPNELFGIKMNHIDKLVLMRLYFYPPNWVLPYTRIAKELSIGLTTIKDSWKRLIKNGYIVEQGEYYIINLNGTGDVPTVRETTLNGTGDVPTMVREMDIPKSGDGHTLVR